METCGERSSLRQLNVAVEETRVSGLRVRVNLLWIQIILFTSMRIRFRMCLHFNAIMDPNPDPAPHQSEAYL
jgi:hypothetical protein